ncbi:MAG TPA: glycoside hydrolase family 3 C-terminal domain-containing protein [Rhodanobacteraceae bacterium]|jgi:beta-glucosidase|nr:glycoside hydrolase family 3 C-terminal domain-containing protein [Rhodanobacteraceae bacterium]
MKAALCICGSIAAIALAAVVHAAPDQATVCAQALVAKLTLEEKVAQLQDDAPAIPRLGVPAYTWWNEGLHGLARGGFATVFPQSIGLAASWDPGLVQQVGTVVSTEARARFNAVGVNRDHGRYQGVTIWSPNINIDRDPRWGRGQETYGEDPYLTGQLAVAFVRGIQGDDPGHPRAIATPKHFAVHSGPEFGRHGFDVDVSPHDLQATYLPAFRAAVTEGHAGSVMCAYNALHGTPVCADKDLLTTTLRNDWGFAGYVVSDCDAIDDMTQFHHYRPDDAQSSAAAIEAGTDLDCGSAYASLGDAVRNGSMKQSALDDALVRLFAARYRLGIMGGDGGAYARIGLDQIDSAAHRKLALQAALESVVLLKNAHDTLPLRAGTRIAVIGPDADTVETLEANYHGTARHPVTPLDGLRQRFGADRVFYAQGAPVAAGVPIPVPETALRTDGRPGLKGEYFDHADFSGKPRLTRVDRRIDFDWDHVAPDAVLDPDHYAVRWTGELVPPGAGDYTLVVHVDRCFDCRGYDPVRLYVDGKKLIDNPGNGRPMQAAMHFADTSPHAIKLEMLHSGQDQGIRLQWLAPATAQLAAAEDAARRADVVVAFVGLSPDVEGEESPLDVAGFDHGDRTDIALPAVQRALLERVAASGKRLVVVLMSGSAVALDWAKQHADAILAAWYPGESGGTAIAQVLAGDYNPAGRLPVTFYGATRDLPPYVSYDMQGRTYRYFTGTPLYPFGYGLSYTTFAYADPALSTPQLKAGATLKVSATVRNTGSRSGDEVVEVYLDYPKSPLAPRHALAGFERVHLKPGESRRVEFELSPRQLSTVDAAGTRAVVAGRYRVFIGGGQPGDAPGVGASFTISGRDALPR